MARGTREDLYGSAPDESPVALLLIDVVNDLDFPEGPRLLRRALPMARRLARLVARARAARVPVVWVNDNFGRWRSDFRELLRWCSRPDARGRPIVELLAPPDDRDYFVLKPKHSGFFETTLELLLRHLGTETVVVTGMATEVCVLFTANDAYMRDLAIVVPSDCVASGNAAGQGHALALMRSALKATIVPSEQIDFPKLGERRWSAARPRAKGARAANAAAGPLDRQRRRAVSLCTSRRSRTARSTRS